VSLLIRGGDLQVDFFCLKKSISEDFVVLLLLLLLVVVDPRTDGAD